MGHYTSVHSKKTKNTVGKRVAISGEEAELLINALQDTWLNYELRGKKSKVLHDLIDRIKKAAKMNESAEVKDPQAS